MWSAVLTITCLAMINSAGIRGASAQRLGDRLQTRLGDGDWEELTNGGVNREDLDNLRPNTRDMDKETKPDCDQTPDITSDSLDRRCLTQPKPTSTGDQCYTVDEARQFIQRHVNSDSAGELTTRQWCVMLSRVCGTPEDKLRWLSIIESQISETSIIGILRKCLLDVVGDGSAVTGANIADILSVIDSGIGRTELENILSRIDADTKKRVLEYVKNNFGPQSPGTDDPQTHQVPCDLRSAIHDVTDTCPNTAADVDLLFAECVNPDCCLAMDVNAIISVLPDIAARDYFSCKFPDADDEDCPTCPPGSGSRCARHLLEKLKVHGYTPCDARLGHLRSCFRFEELSSLQCASVAGCVCNFPDEAIRFFAQECQGLTDDCLVRYRSPEEVDGLANPTWCATHNLANILDRKNNSRKPGKFALVERIITENCEGQLLNAGLDDIPPRVITGDILQQALSRATIDDIVRNAEKIKDAVGERMKSNRKMAQIADRVKEISPTDKVKILKKTGSMRILPRQQLCDEIDPNNFNTAIGETQTSLDAGIVMGDSDSDNDLGLSTENQGDLSPEQARCLCKKLTANKKPEDVTADDLMKYGEVIKGCTSEFFRDWSSSDRIENALVIFRTVKGLSDSQTKEVVEQLVFGLADQTTDDNQNYMSQMDTAVVDVLGPDGLRFLLPEEIAAASGDVCEGICLSLASADSAIAFYSDVDCMNIAKACLGCKNPNRDPTASLTEEEMKLLGPAFAPCMEDALFDTIPETSGALSTIAGGCFTKDQLQILGKKLDNVIKSVSDAVEVGELMGAATNLNATENDLVDEAIMSPGLADEISEELSPANGTEAAEAQERCDKRRDAASNAFNKELKERTLNRVKEAFSDTTQSVRRRRATTQFTCDTLTQMAGAVVALTVEEINAITEAEFKNCIGYFGGIYTWNTQQLDAMLDRVRTIFGGGDLCTLDATTISVLGSILTALPAEKISCLTLNNDIISDLGAMSTWSEEQRIAFLNKYLSINDIAADSLNAANVADLGHFICALSTSQISQLDPMTYRDSAGIVGKLEVCPLDRLQEFATLAKHPDVNGDDVSKWTHDVTSEAGIVLAGLTESDVSMITEEAMEGFTTGAIAAMPTDLLKEFSSAHLSALGNEQTLALSPEQLSALSPEQVNAILMIRDGQHAAFVPTTTTTAATAGSGSGSLRAALCTALAAIAAFVLCYVL